MHDFSSDLNELSGAVINTAMKAHSLLGPGLLEKVYEEAMNYYLLEQGIDFERQKDIPINLPEARLDAGFRIDFLVGKKIIVELKAVEKIIPLHEAQIQTYLKLTGLEIGLLLNFNVTSMRDGIRRIVLSKNSAPLRQLRV